MRLLHSDSLAIGHLGVSDGQSEFESEFDTVELLRKPNRLYCGSLLIGAPRKTPDKLQRVLNAAARIISNTRKYDRGPRQFQPSELHWLVHTLCHSRCSSVCTI